MTDPNIRFILQANTPDEIEIDAGFFVETLGNTTGRTFDVADGGGVLGLSAGTTVNLDGASGDFEIVRNGTTLEIHDGGGDVAAQIAGGADVSTVNFADGSADLRVDFEAGDLVFGDARLANDGATATGAAVIDDNGGSNDAPAIEGDTELNVTFADDPELDGHRDDFEAALNTAWDAWMEHIDSDPTASVNVNVFFQSDSAAIARTFFRSSQDTGRVSEDGAIIGTPVSVAKVDPGTALDDGIDPDAIDTDIQIGSDPDRWDFGPGTAEGFIDAESVLKHEFGRVLGVNVFNRPDFKTPFEERRDLDTLTFDVDDRLGGGDLALRERENGTDLADGLGVMSEFPGFDTVSETITAADLQLVGSLGVPVDPASLDLLA